MGLTYCKSLFTKSKTTNSVNNGNGSQSSNQSAVPTPATAAEYQVTTIQTAVESQDTPQVLLTNPTSSIIMETNDQNERFIEKVVCDESDLDENEMKEVDMGDDKKVLLIKQNGKISATVAKCPHFDLPLVYGAVGNGRIRCPFHGACFNIETGDIEDFPGLDSLPCFQVKIDEGKVKVRAKKSDLEKGMRTKLMLMETRISEQVFVIIGGGPSAQICAETLRQNAFNGRILMICKEKFLPYDRIHVNKFMDKKIEQIQFRSKEFYDENQIEILLNTAATSLDTNIKEVLLSSGAKVRYDKIYIATGSRSKKPTNIIGNGLKNIFTVQDITDGNAIHEKLNPSSHVVVLGSGFIALESAAYCVGKVEKITVVGRSAIPLTESFGPAIGERIMKLCKENNIEFIMNSGIKSFLAINQEETLSAVKLLDDQILKADICIVGIGSDLNTDFLHNSGISINEKKSIDTNIYLETNIPDVYVGGDIANSPIYCNNNELATIGHYGLAQYHGKIAALNMIGTRTELKAVPYFFTYLLGQSFTYTGHGKATEIFIDGDLESLRYLAFYFDETDRVVGMAACQPEKKIPEFAEKLSQGQKIMKKDLWSLMGIKIETPKPIKAVLPPTVYVEKIVCNESDIDEDEMKEFDMGENRKVLLIKQHGEIYALGAHCAHYNVSLVSGALGQGRIRCPWHGACYNIETGDIEDFPGLDSLPCFQVDIEEGKVKVRAKKSDLENGKRTKSMAVKGPSSGEIFVIIGGGPSAQTCAETLRQNGFNGRILMICKEKFLPYDRIKINKYLNIKIEEVQLRSKEFYDENHIEVSLNVTAMSLTTELKEISLSSGVTLKYDKLFIATGSSAIKPTFPGSELENIFTIRSLEDAHAINSKLQPSSHVVVLGTSFIGLEVAGYCVDKVKKVTMIGRDTVPLIGSFGEVLGSRIMELFESKNIEFIMNSGIKSFHGHGKVLESIELLSGQILEADVCIAGIGAELNTEFLRNSGIFINNDGSVDTNVYLETNITDVYVGGDIANSPIFINNNELATIGHYALAQTHGKIAALNMLGTKTELKVVPYFFTFLFGNCFTYTGHGKASEIFIEGDLDSLKFVAFYFDENERVIAMSTCQPDKSIAEFAEKLAQGYQFHKDDIEWVHDNE